MEVKLPTEGTRYVQALLLTATAYLQYRAHFLPAVAAYRGYGRPAVPKVPVQALRACLAIGHGTLPLPSVAWTCAIRPSCLRGGPPAEPSARARHRRRTRRRRPRSARTARTLMGSTDPLSQNTTRVLGAWVDTLVLDM
jgi:hypothetical protein